MSQEPRKPAGPFSIGSTLWPGLSKLVEEMGEVQQVVGKLIATGGAAAHWDGSDLRQRLTDELADLMAAGEFVAMTNGIDLEPFRGRRRTKLDQFYTWHREQMGAGTDLPTAAQAHGGGCGRRADGTPNVPDGLDGLARKRFLRTLLRLEAVTDPPADLNRRRRDFRRASGDCLCASCGLPFYDHPPDIDGEPDAPGGASLTILCDRTRVKL